MRQIVLIANNIRSAFNVGSLFRTAEGLGIEKLFLCGYTPHPAKKDDDRLPYISEKIDRAINKTALGATENLPWEQRESIEDLLGELKDKGFHICALEQSKNSIDLHKFAAPSRVALVLGEEVHGLSDSILELCDQIIEIPMFGKKESFNVSVAAAMALYHLRFTE